MPISGAIATAKLAKVGFGGSACAIAIGMVLGSRCDYVIRIVGHEEGDLIGRMSVSVQENCFRALYLVAILWAVVALFLGARISSVLLRFLKA